MKRIINGKKYDTETATKVCDYEYSHCGDFNWCYEVLYKKKTGEFFIYGKGGPLSSYSRTEGGTSYGSSEITPITLNEAKKFAEENASVEIYEEYFGEVEE